MKHAGVTRSGPDQVQPGSMSKGVASEAVYQKCTEIKRYSNGRARRRRGGSEMSAPPGRGLPCNLLICSTVRSRLAGRESGLTRSNRSLADVNRELTRGNRELTPGNRGWREPIG